MCWCKEHDVSDISNDHIWEVTRLNVAEFQRQKMSEEAMSIVRSNIAKHMPSQVARETLRAILLIVNLKK